MPQKQEPKRVQNEAMQIENEFQWELGRIDPKAVLQVGNIFNREAVRLSVKWGDGSSSSEDLDTGKWRDKREQYSLWIQDYLNAWKLTS